MSKTPFSWKCPYCGSKTTIIEENYSHSYESISIDGWKHGKPAIVWKAIVCPNEECRELKLSIGIHRYGLPRGAVGGTYSSQEQYFNFDLLPESPARPLPAYIPEGIRKSYIEACRIVNLSANASATLSRRCLQGMIRDFFQIECRSLFDEIDAIKGRIDHSLWLAVDRVRSFGNIGAHMKMEANVIADVDPGEAEALVDIIELLIDETYIARHDREQRVASALARTSRLGSE